MPVNLAAYVDISAESSPHVMKRRVWSSCATLPDGARLTLHVGFLAPEPEVVHLLRDFSCRLRIEITGAGQTLVRWYEATVGELVL